MEHWDEQVGVSFLFRADPSARAAELGYPYLPQEVVTKEEYDAYVAKLSNVELGGADSDELADEDCPTGACPVH